jgi:hypothetical protein
VFHVKTAVVTGATLDAQSLTGVTTNSEDFGLTTHATNGTVLIAGVVSIATHHTTTVAVGSVFSF